MLDYEPYSASHASDCRHSGSLLDAKASSPVPVQDLSTLAMKLSEKLVKYSSGRPFFTFEFFPPKTRKGFDFLLSRIARLNKFNPLAVSITWGAGGSTKDRSLELAGICQLDYGIDTILHLTCTNMERGMVDEALKAAKEHGIQTILALRGDPPRGAESWIPTDARFTHGIDLVTYIRSNPEFSSEFCIGVGAYPDGHPDRNDLSEEDELTFLKAKVDAGADFIVTQLFYDVDLFIRWVKKVREKGINVPIIPGIMPIQTYGSFMRLVKLCGSKVPPEVMSALEPIHTDDQQVKDYGIQLAVSIAQRLMKEENIHGVQFCTLNLENSVQRILETLGWIPTTPKFQNKLITDMPLTDPAHLITPTNAATTAADSLLQIQSEGTASTSDLSKVTTWDDFPNGRFGDSNSPAFNIQGQWGGSTITPSEISQWGHPKDRSDLTNLFLRYLDSSISTTPFSPGPLSAESRLILPHLVKLTSLGLWTAGSQPALDAAPSSDSLVGWGPEHGYIFQKAFVEFFCPLATLNRIQEKVHAEGNGYITWFAASGGRDPQFMCSDDDEVRNVVTWGVFPGQEIVQSTIIEKEAFLAWKEDAFATWAAWASFYPPDSEQRVLLERITNEMWLVNIVHHDFRNPESLWSFLFNGMSLTVSIA